MEYKKECSKWNKKPFSSFRSHYFLFSFFQQGCPKLFETLIIPHEVLETIRPCCPAEWYYCFEVPLRKLQAASGCLLGTGMIYNYIPLNVNYLLIMNAPTIDMMLEIY